MGSISFAILERVTLEVENARNRFNLGARRTERRDDDASVVTNGFTSIRCIYHLLYQHMLCSKHFRGYDLEFVIRMRHDFHVTAEALDYHDY